MRFNPLNLTIKEVVVRSLVLSIPIYFFVCAVRLLRLASEKHLFSAPGDYIWETGFVIDVLFAMLIPLIYIVAYIASGWRPLLFWKPKI